MRNLFDCDDVRFVFVALSLSTLVPFAMISSFILSSYLYCDVIKISNVCEVKN
jgi:hypothetical protein